MELPRHLCRQVFEIAPYARLAWAGEPSKDPNELNPGGFAIVELARAQDIGSLDEPRTVKELWHVTTRSDTYGKAVRRRANRGPIFNRWGGTAPDWDMLAQVPVFVGRPKDYGISNASFYQGAVIPMLRRWESSLKARIDAARREKAKEVKNQLTEISKDGTDRLWSMANQSGAGGLRTTTREERVKEHERIINQRADFEGYYAGKSRY